MLLVAERTGQETKSAITWRRAVPKYLLDWCEMGKKILYKIHLVRLNLYRLLHPESRFTDRPECEEDGGDRNEKAKNWRERLCKIMLISWRDKLAGR